MRRTLMVLGMVALPVVANAQVVISPGGGGPQTMRFSSRGGVPGSDILEAGPAAYGVTGWTVGEWARYSATRVLNAQMGINVQGFRLVSVLSQGGGKYQVEVQDDVMQPQRQSPAIRKMQLSFGPVNRDRAAEVTIFDPQDSSIVRQTTLRAARPSDIVPVFPDGWTKAGPEDVTVKAGTFHAIRWTKGTEEVWLAPNAGPIGVVKFKNDDTTLELVARGETGAKSKIPESGQ